MGRQADQIKLPQRAMAGVQRGGGKRSPMKAEDSLNVFFCVWERFLAILVEEYFASQTARTWEYWVGDV